MSDEAFAHWLRTQSIALETQSTFPITSSRRTATNALPRNQPLSHPLYSLQSYDHNGTVLRPGITVQLSDGGFLRIILVIKNFLTNEITLRGWLFRRTHTLHGLLSRKRNEVYWSLSVDDDDKRDPKEQAPIERRITEVVQTRTLKLTNRPYPQLSFRENCSRQIYNTNEAIENEGVLICRWKFVCSYANARARQSDVHIEEALIRLDEEDCDRECGVDMESLRRDWRGPTVKGGSCFGIEPAEADHHRDEFSENEKAKTFERRKIPASSFFSSRDNSTKQHASGANFRPSNNTPSFVRHGDIPKYQKNTEMSPNCPTTQEVEGPEPRRKRRRLLEIFERIDVDLSGDDGISKSLEPLVIDASVNLDRTSSRYVSSKTRSSRQVQSTNIIRKLQFTSQWHTTERQRDSHPALNRVPRVINPYLQTRPDRSTGYTPSLPLSKSQRLVAKDTASVAKPVSESKKAFADRANLEFSSQRYSFGDCYCGAGGMTRGAVQAGLCVKWGVDMDENVSKTWELNFPFATMFHLPADVFAMLKELDLQIDILHLSPPCQPYSPAHTVVGKDDDRNTASLFAVTMLLKRTRPRVVTVENTFGLERRHFLYMNALVNLFTCVGVEYSIRWKIVNLKDFGGPQSRKRLIVIASWSVSKNYSNPNSFTS